MRGLWRRPGNGPAWSALAALAPAAVGIGWRSGELLSDTGRGGPRRASAGGCRGSGRRQRRCGGGGQLAEGQVRDAVRRVRVEEEEGALLGAQAGASRKGS